MKIHNAPPFSQNKNNYRKNINFEAVRIKQISHEYLPLRSTLETELDYFVRKGDNAQPIGKGLSAVVYGFNRFKDIVFKKASNNTMNFNDEIKNLKMLPDRLNTVQKFIAQAYDDENGIYYLISTKMQGKPAHPHENPYTKEHLSSLFNTFFELDKKGIYHGDFNIGNILLDTEGQVNFIDFQWMQKLEEKRFFEDKPKMIIPPFMLSENSQMFEMASFPFYIRHMSHGKDFLKTYLTEKSVYHEKRANYLETLLPNWQYKDEKKLILKGINYENAQAILFKNPSEDILEIETKKLQFLSNFREAFSRQDRNNPEGNFVTSLSSHLLTLSSLQELRSAILQLNKQKYLSNAKRDYLKYTDEYAKYWFANIKSWINSILDENINRAVHVENERIPVGGFDEFVSVTDIVKIIDEDYRAGYNNVFDLEGKTNNLQYLKDIKRNYNNLKIQTLSLIFDAKVNRKQNEMKRVHEKLKNAVKNNQGLDVINLSILSIVKNRELKQLIVKKSNVSSRDKIITELHEMRLIYERIARETFNSLLEEISADTPKSMRLTGYQNMWQFE